MAYFNVTDIYARELARKAEATYEQRRRRLEPEVTALLREIGETKVEKYGSGVARTPVHTSDIDLRVSEGHASRLSASNNAFCFILGGLRVFLVVLGHVV